MISSVELFFDDEENVQDIASIRRNLRDKSNPLELPSALFKAYFRLPKDPVVYVVETLKDDFKKTKRLRKKTYLFLEVICQVSQQCVFQGKLQRQVCIIFCINLHVKGPQRKI
ncbi:uncharacterized protein [Musca autumnalis]|uniref:uncharacterized protein n=1 Tax=Musca autumnalis TaxID=221902 RepID=UPI003CED0716